MWHVRLCFSSHRWSGRSAVWDPGTGAGAMYTRAAVSHWAEQPGNSKLLSLETCEHLTCTQTGCLPSCIVWALVYFQSFQNKWQTSCLCATRCASLDRLVTFFVDGSSHSGSHRILMSCGSVTVSGTSNTSLLRSTSPGGRCIWGCMTSVRSAWGFSRRTSPLHTPTSQKVREPLTD